MENEMILNIKNDCLEVIFRGEIDHLNTQKYRERLIYVLSEHQYPEVILNFKDVHFIDSSGIGMVLGRYNQINSYQGTLYFSELSDSVKRLFELSGLLKLIDRKEVSYHG